MNKRGGFDRIRTKDVTDPVSFEIYFRVTPGERPITYEVSFDVDENGRPFALSERLRQRRLGQKSGRPFSFLMLDGDKGIAWKGDAVGYKGCVVAGSVFAKVMPVLPSPARTWARTFWTAGARSAETAAQPASKKRKFQTRAS